MKKKSDLVNELSATAGTVWEYLTNPRLLLVTYLKSRSIQCTDKETESIFKKLKSHSYEYAFSAFDNDIDRLVEGISYNRNVDKIMKLWVDKTGLQTITDWCKEYFSPIAWVLTTKQYDVVRVIRDIQDGQKVEPTVLATALREFDNGDFSVLQNISTVRNAFFSQVGENYRAAWNADEKLLRGRLTTKKELGADVYTWANKVAEIRKVFNAYIKENQVKEAKKRVQEMSEKELRDKVIALLDINPEQYEIFLK